MDSVGMHMEGMDAVLSNLKAFGSEVANKEVLKAMRAGARPMKAAMIRNAPVSDGPRRHPDKPRIRDNIKITTRRSKISGSYSIRVGPGKENWYAHFPERGHAIVKRGERRTRLQRRIEAKTGKSVFTGSNLTFVPATPYIRPAFESEHDNALDIIHNKLKAFVDNWSGAA